jgi:hypothetical protein
LLKDAISFRGHGFMTPGVELAFRYAGHVPLDRAVGW